MPSPFPGMDPYIEDPFFWPDFHGSIIGIMREALNQVLPSRYVASMDRNVWLQDHPGEEVTLLGGPDVPIADRGKGDEGVVATATATAQVAAPVNLLLPYKPWPGNRSLRILDRHRRRIVTVLEVLSPANKTRTGYGGRPCKSLNHRRPTTTSWSAPQRLFPRRGSGLSPFGSRCLSCPFPSTHIANLSFSTCVPVWIAPTTADATPMKSITGNLPFLL